MQKYLVRISFAVLFLIGLTQTLQAVIPDLSEYGCQNRKQFVGCVLQIIKAVSEGQRGIKLRDGVIYQIRYSLIEQATCMSIDIMLGGFFRKGVATAF